MTKNEFVKVVSEKLNATQRLTEEFLSAIVETVTETLKRGEKIQFVGFGNFEIKEVAEKEGVNPQTKAKVIIPACKKPVLRFGKAYKDIFNA